MLAAILPDDFFTLLSLVKCTASIACYKARTEERLMTASITTPG